MKYDVASLVVDAEVGVGVVELLGQLDLREVLVDVRLEVHPGVLPQQLPRIIYIMHYIYNAVYI